MTCAGYPEDSEAARLFGRPSGRHTHPDTHPYWLQFADGDCPVCGPAGYAARSAHLARVRRLQQRIGRPGCFR